MAITVDTTKAVLPMLFFEDQSAWEAWLALTQADQKGVRIKIAKKGSGIKTVTYDEAVESALCYGWIDSQAASYDSQYYLQKFSPRRARSKWSKLNREKAEALIAAGKMQPAGYRQVEQAKADGRWEAAYDPQSQISVPEDLQRALDQNRAAKEFFNTLNSINRYAILHRIQDAKKTATRAARIRKYLDMLIKHQKVYP
jgi:uncharacterized protein YdeI (YjbR/CyaY-like superfamily)